ncbi:MAG: hypothetical protein CFE21_08735 [Bacteroidetes bacterium B1(2017)]|nr:MAG: hypothetical protein CFE21_08735 [Bacteroidetes bacterium B1(2017)]
MKVSKVLLPLVLLLSYAGFSQCVNPNSYTTTFTVSNTSNSAYTNKTILVNFNSALLVSQGKMQATGSDIRFGLDCCTPFPFWIDSTTINTANTQIFVRIPSLAASSNLTLKMFHGSTSLTSQSNFATTFTSAYILNSGVDSLTGVVNYDWFQVKAGATLYIRYGNLLEINAANILIQGSIDGNERGYAGPASIACAAGSGPGAGTLGTSCANGGGAGYGGVGGCAPVGGAGSCSSAGGIVYGTTNGYDIAMGSSGSTGSSGGAYTDRAGNGGGGIKLVGSKVTINGIITVNGMDGKGGSSSNSSGGGGSGGGILVHGVTLNLAGAILMADGGKAGNVYGGAGAGGRIKLFRVQSISGTYTTSVLGNIASTFSSPVNLFTARGANGTVYADTLTSNQVFTSPVSTTFAPCGLVYFSKPTGALNDTLTWGTNPDGTGTNPHNFSANGVYYNVTNNGAPTLTANWFVTGTNTVVVFGDGINAGNMVFPSNYIFGADTFFVNNNFTATILGSILTNKPGFGLSSNAQYTSSSAQNILGATYGNLILSGSSKNLLNDVRVLGTLLQLNNINCGAYTFTLGSSATQTGTLNRVSGAIYGKFTRWFGTNTTSGMSGLFPIGKNGVYYPIQFDFISAPSTGGSISFEFVPGNPGNIGFPIYDFTNSPIVYLDKTAINGFWRMTNTSISGGTYTISATGTGFYGISYVMDLRLVRRSTPTGSWTIPSNSELGTGTNAIPVVKRSNMNVYGGDFAIASDSSINALPLELLSFEASKLDKQALLSWTTASEENNSKFELEKSLDGRSFERIATQKACGTCHTKSSYSYVDMDAFEPIGLNTLYYRLKQVDFDGTYSYTHRIVLSNNEALADALTVYPNPSQGSFILSVNTELTNTYMLDVFTNLGELAYSKTCELGSNQNVLVDTKLVPGIYLLKLSGASGTQTRKLLVY